MASFLAAGVSAAIPSLILLLLAVLENDRWTLVFFFWLLGISWWTVPLTFFTCFWKRADYGTSLLIGEMSSLIQLGMLWFWFAILDIL
jgi:hypothetical protein